MMLRCRPLQHGRAAGAGAGIVIAGAEPVGVVGNARQRVRQDLDFGRKIAGGVGELIGQQIEDDAPGVVRLVAIDLVLDQLETGDDMLDALAGSVADLQRAEHGSDLALHAARERCGRGGAPRHMKLIFGEGFGAVGEFPRHHRHELLRPRGQLPHGIHGAAQRAHEHRDDVAQWRQDALALAQALDDVVDQIFEAGVVHRRNADVDREDAQRLQDVLGVHDLLLEMRGGVVDGAEQ